MEGNQFDRVSKLFAERRLSRRRALAKGGAGLAAVVVGARAAAQDATPEGAADADGAGKVPYLFVQSFGSGSIAPAADGRYTVPLADGLGQTLYFSDRPARDVGALATPTFLEGLGFSDDNPPNAALVMETGPGETDIAVVELYSPVYDESTKSATYEVATLANWEQETGLGLWDAPTDLATVAPTFGVAHLFIDDCAAANVSCGRVGQAPGMGEVVYFDVPMCFNLGRCMPCEGAGTRDCDAERHWSLKCDQDLGGGGESASWPGSLLMCTPYG